MKSVSIIGSLLAVGFGVVACDDEPLDPNATTGSLVLKIVAAAQQMSRVAGSNSGPALGVASPLTHLENVTVTVTGPETTTVDLLQTATGFEGEITGLEPGTYEVTVTGLVGGEVDHFGRTTGVNVVAGETTEANVPFRSFVPDVSPFTSPTLSTTIPVGFTTVAAADSYDIEWQGNALRVAGPGPDAQITVGAPGTIDVTVRAFSSTIGQGRGSDPQSVVVQTDTLEAPGGGATALGFGTAASGSYASLNILPVGDVDDFSIPLCTADTLNVDVNAGRMGSALDARLDILLPGNVLDTTDDNSAGSLDPSISYLAAADLDYIVRVSASPAASTADPDRRVGTYTLVVDVRKGPSNQDTFCGRPDLRPTVITGPASAQAGGFMTVDVTVANNGSVAAPAGWIGEIRLSADQVIDGADFLVGTYTEGTSIGPALSSASSVALAVPESIPAGTYFLGVIVDATDNVSEQDETNNSVASIGTINITGLTLSAGAFHTCRVAASGSVECWGLNDDGQLGNGTTQSTSAPVAIVGGTAAAVSGGGFHTCAIDATSGQAFCWGLNGDGQLGDGTFNTSTTPVPVFGANVFRSISAGGLHTCGILTDGTARCWGANFDGQLGDGTTNISSTPVVVLGGITFASISAGDVHTCGVATDDTGYCWGNNTSGRLGDGTTINRTAPAAVSGGITFASISAGENHTCGVATDGTANCWGFNFFGQLGDNTFLDSPSPVVVAGGLTWLGVGAGGAHSCGVASDRTVSCWGNSFVGQLGDGSVLGGAGAPVMVAGPYSAQALSVGGLHTCGVDLGGVVSCWGYTGFGQIGDGTPVTNVPLAISGALSFQAVTGGRFHGCGLLTVGSQRCWGDNSFSGELGDGTGINSTTPVTVSGGLIMQSISSWLFHTCGLTTANDAFCWGNNIDGQLGDGTNTDGFTPVAVIGGLKFAVIDPGHFHTCAVDTLSQAFCWGFNLFGELGNGTTTDTTSPAQVSGGLGFLTVTAGRLHSCGVDTLGSGHCWGDNTFGQLGTGTTVGSNTPVAVTGVLTFASIGAGVFHTCGLTTTGSAHCWGDNRDGQLGDGTGTSSLSPVLVLGGLTFQALTVGGHHNCGIDLTGNAHCWGYNFDGEIGNNSFVQANTPQLVSGGLIFASVDAGIFHSCGVTTTGLGFCWGENILGQLGNGTTSVRATPTPVTGLSPLAGIPSARVTIRLPSRRSALVRHGRNRLTDKLRLLELSERSPTRRR